MLTWILVPVILGLICLAISRHYRYRIERMDADYAGDILPNPEEEGWQKYGRMINYRIMKATRYIGYTFFFFAICMLAMPLLAAILDLFAPSR